MKVGWHRFEDTEAQSFAPDAGTNRAILFCPGCPGMGATVFEQRHAAALAEEGYAVYVIKHKGTRLSGALAPVMVNNAQRLREGRAREETHLGGGAATMEEWMAEPLAVLNAIHGQYETIDVIGNSFGALSALWSLTDAGANIEKVRSVLLFAGAQGVWDDSEDSMSRIWQPEFLMAARITEKVTLNDAFDVVATLKHAYEILPERVRALSTDIAITYLVVERDELLRLRDTEKFNEAIGGRGKIVMDTVDHAWFEHGLLAHDTPNFPTEDLLELIGGGA